MTGPASKAERDRIRQRAGRRGQVLQEVNRILGEYREGRAASACMRDLETIMQRLQKKRGQANEGSRDHNA